MLQLQVFNELRAERECWGKQFVAAIVQLELLGVTSDADTARWVVCITANA